MANRRRTPTRISLLALSLCAAVVTPSAPAQAALSYTVGGTWPNDAHRTAAEDAIQLVTNRYNSYGDFGNNNVYVYYNTGIPTAQASYNGSIGFGGTYPNERIMAHEMAHYLGLPSGNWGSLMTGGSWDGTFGLSKVRQLDGEQATINGDGAHFWPYGLNYDNEGSELNKQRQVELVYAMRIDLGIGVNDPPGSNRTVTLTADNPAGESGFNFKNQWSDGYTPHAGAVYYTDDFLLRTPASGNAFKFYGGPLVVDNSDGAGGGLHYYGQSATSLVTVDDLRLEGGWVQHTGAAGTRFRLDGNVNVVTNSVLRAKQGNIDVLSRVTGAGDLTIETTDSPDQNDRYVRFLASNNTFVGDLVNLSRFELAAGANFRFAIGPGGSTNAITGPAARATLLNGSFDLDLSSATQNAGDSWALVTAANTSYGGSFKINGFSNLAGVWSNGGYLFSQTTGLLTLVPAWNVDGGGAWSTAGNWIGGVPSVNGEATLGSVLTAPHAPATINIDVPVSLQRLTFDNPNQYVLAGANPVTLSGGALVVAKSGSHKINVPISGNSGLNLSGAGTIELTASNSYTGDTHINSGTLRLGGNASIAASANIRVHSGATLDVAPLAGGLQLAGQSLDTADNGTVVGSVIANGGSMVSGSGTHAGHVTVRFGSVLRVGAANLPSAAVAGDLTSIDDFQGYSSGKLNAGATGGVWSGVFEGTDNAQVVNDSGNKALEFYGAGNAWRGTRTSLANSFGPADHSLANSDKATYFFRLQRRGTQSIDGIFGLSDLDSIGTDAPWQELAVTMSLFQGTAAGDTTALRAYDGDGGGDVVLMNNVAANQWINIWLVVDNQSKTYQVATSLGANNGALFPNTFQFGRQAALGAALDTFAGAEYRSVFGGRNSSSVRIDDLYQLDWNDLTNPLAIVGETLTIEGNLTLDDPTALLQMNVANPVTHDRLVVTGTAQFAGVLEVELQSGNSLALGDTFDLFDFATASGAFDVFDLPALGADRRWDLSQLALSGSIAVAMGLDGDFNADGIVDAADYTHWRDNLGSTEDAAILAGNGSEDGFVNDADYQLWKSNFGATLAGAAQAAAVPEASSVALFAIACAVCAVCRPNWR